MVSRMQNQLLPLTFFDVDGTIKICRYADLVGEPFKILIQPYPSHQCAVKSKATW